MTHYTQNILHHWREAVPNDRLAHLIRDAARAFHRSLQVRLARHNVSFGHWTFLRILWESGGLTQKELSERAGVMEPTTFSAMKAMETLGYIERKQIPTNRKNMYVHLTPKGQALKKLLVPMAEETNNVSIKGIAGENLKITRQVLLAMIENLARDEAALDTGGKQKAPAKTKIPRASNRIPAGLPTRQRSAPGETEPKKNR